MNTSAVSKLLFRFVSSINSLEIFFSILECKFLGSLFLFRSMFWWPVQLNINVVGVPIAKKFTPSLNWLSIYNQLITSLWLHVICPFFQKRIMCPSFPMMFVSLKTSFVNMLAPARVPWAYIWTRNFKNSWSISTNQLHVALTHCTTIKISVKFIFITMTHYNPPLFKILVLSSEYHILSPNILVVLFLINKTVRMYHL